jgi:GTP pyrophosphokinase
LHSQRLTDAFDYASSLHSDHTRKGIECPYLSHLLGVASYVLEYGGSEDAVIGALLHDAAEDKGGAATLTEIARRFGAHVAKIVEQCSDSIVAEGAPKAGWEERKRGYIASLRHKHADALLVTACDKLHNGSAILSDHKESEATNSSPVWERFGGKSAAQVVSYYSAMRAELAGRIPASLERRFGQVVHELEEAVNRDEHITWVQKLRA